MSATTRQQAGIMQGSVPNWQASWQAIANDPDPPRIGLPGPGASCQQGECGGPTQVAWDSSNARDAGGKVAKKAKCISNTCWPKAQAACSCQPRRRLPCGTPASSGAGGPLTRLLRAERRQPSCGRSIAQSESASTCRKQGIVMRCVSTHWPAARSPTADLNQDALRQAYLPLTLHMRQRLGWGGCARQLLTATLFTGLPVSTLHQRSEHAPRRSLPNLPTSAVRSQHA